MFARSMRINGTAAAELPDMEDSARMTICTGCYIQSTPASPLRDTAAFSERSRRVRHRLKTDASKQAEADEVVLNSDDTAQWG